MIIAALVLLSLSLCSAARTVPSFLVLLADDLGYGDVEYNGGYARTPNFNMFVNSPHSLKLDAYHSGSSLCSPSRVALISGRYPDRECMSGNQHSNTKEFDYRTDMPSIAREAKRAGLKTAYIGKFGIGNTPGTVGYDFWIASGGAYPTYDPSCFCNEVECIRRKTKCAQPTNTCFISKSSKKCQSTFTKPNCDFGPYTYFPFSQENTCFLTQGSIDSPTVLPVNVPRKEMSCNFLFTYFVDYLNTLQELDSFLIEISFMEPHEPIIASPELRSDCFNLIGCNKNMSKINDAKTNYFGAVNGLDRILGKIYSELESRNRLHDTVIIFSSDNGVENLYSNVGLSGPFSGRKRSIYEGGTRVPSFIHWPDKISQNYRVSQVTSSLDFISTIQDILIEYGALVDKGTDRATDGVSLYPLIKNPINWVRSKGFGLCKPVDMTTSTVCAGFSYVKGNLKVIGKKSAKGLAGMLIYNLTSDIAEKKGVAPNTNLQAYSALVQEAQSVFADIISENKQSCPRNG